MTGRPAPEGRMIVGHWTINGVPACASPLAGLRCACACTQADFNAIDPNAFDGQQLAWFPVPCPRPLACDYDGEPHMSPAETATFELLLMVAEDRAKPHGGGDAWARVAYQDELISRLRVQLGWDPLPGFP